ncbi:hypothetical protein [Streptomyces sp. NBC_01304]|uniref:hypothetical protein n=1 Tax=Streptomyces sp. NBC_01304 TaxID=2903818 RepID=UPI002E13C7AF|nr:hypothetical protein OG430_05345 [Streptomyces sp. NBC_01304]
MDPIVLATGTALVGAMATDAWEQARSAVIAVWRRVRPAQVDEIDEELVEARARVLTARQTGAAEAELALTAGWQNRLQSLLRENPAVAGELRELLDAQLTPLLTRQEQTRIGTLTMRAKATGHTRVYQAGRDQHITE